MRELSSGEKSIIKILVEREIYNKEHPWDWYSVTSGSIFMEFARLYRSYFKIINIEPINQPEIDEEQIKFNDKEPIDTKEPFKPIIELMTYYGDIKNGLSKSNDFRREFITSLYFIEYLRKENLIYIVPINNEARLNPLEGGFKGNISDGQPTTIIDKNFIDLVNYYHDKNIIPTEYLVKYYERDCIGEEEVRFNKAIDIANNGVTKTTIAIWIAIFVGIATIGTTIWYAPKPDNRIDDLTKVVSGFILEQKEINKEIYSLKESDIQFKKELLELKNNQTEMMKLIKKK